MPRIPLWRLVPPVTIKDSFTIVPALWRKLQLPTKKAFYQFFQSRERNGLCLAHMWKWKKTWLAEELCRLLLHRIREQTRSTNYQEVLTVPDVPWDVTSRVMISVYSSIVVCTNFCPVLLLFPTSVYSQFYSGTCQSNHVTFFSFHKKQSKLCHLKIRRAECFETLGWNELGPKTRMRMLMSAYSYYYSPHPHLLLLLLWRDESGVMTWVTGTFEKLWPASI